ncbi:hypothetical protein MtrunA17_Chr3g0121941 [Medicago truncatula]|uniref:Uncharacterized protein n=1 Tax=Medicago truncatula TaxID=3880 RepID=A0A396IUG0_MEDTR|nr:hypothetical protein MtrunA17_Chr3g0121941 [Medicago truncatula]
MHNRVLAVDSSKILNPCSCLSFLLLLYFLRECKYCSLSLIKDFVPMHYVITGRK